MRKLAIFTAIAVTLYGTGCSPAGTGTQQQAAETAAPSPSAAPGAPAAETAPPALPKDADTGGEQVTIYRDKWGVPHIYADTDKAAMYGLGYAEAEDRITDLYANARIASGTASEVLGDDNLRTDFVMQLVRNEEMAKKSLEEAPALLRELTDSFVAGIDAYVAQHPDKKPEWAADFEPWQCAAIGRAMVLRWPLGNVLDDLEHKSKEHKTPVSNSNEWSVSPKRTATGGAILLTDPHVGWEGMEVFYEARVHGDTLHMNGFFIVGSPLLGFGHTNYVGWAPTTGGPDTADVYEVPIDVSNLLKPKYQIDGQWHEFAASEIKVKTKSGETKTQPRLETDLGPVFDVDMKNKVAYIGASPYFGTSHLFEQTYGMITAKNVDEFYKALGMLQLMDQNIMFADTSGNIEYVRNGNTPKRNPQFDWNAPVPASAQSIWTETHPIEDLVQIKNPGQGYMQNCNVSPENMMTHSPLTPDKYPKYIYNVSWDTNNPRSKRIVELLDGDDSVTREDALAYATNVYDIRSKPWQQALAAAMESGGGARAKDETFAKVVKDILAWDGQFLPETTVTVVYKKWRENSDKTVNVQAIVDGKTLNAEEKTALLDQLAAAIDETKKTYGTAEIPWGEVYRVGRGGKYFPAPGADFLGSTDGINMTETLFDVRSSPDKDNPGKFVGDNGSQTTMLMLFHPDGVESYTLCPWGESGDPTSKHYMDQGEHLYGKRSMKPTWWKKEDLLADPANVESELTLEVP